MGYDLHITRRDHWTDDGADIALSEWQAIVERDPDLAWQPELGPTFAIWSGPSGRYEHWLAWTNGTLYAKNPDAPLIDKMATIARLLHARVQGDDGEFYDAADSPVEAPRKSLAERVRVLVSKLRSSGRATRKPPFHVGDRVRDVAGSEGTVTALDREALNGLGSFDVHYDSGLRATFVTFSHKMDVLHEGETAATDD
jgi:hypothetical protein